MTQMIKTQPPRPNWTDRQMIAAADLRAEQGWQDAQLARLRRFAMGWGVVAGLEVDHRRGDIEITAGYGISPLGAEIYVAEPVVIEGAHGLLLRTCCGGDGDSCALPEVSEDDGVKTAWIVLRPHVWENCPRPLVPEGCAHPGSAFAYARQGAALQVEVVCALDEGYIAGDPDCERTQAMLDGRPVGMPTSLDDILPIAEVTFTRTAIIGLDVEPRQRLLPVAVLQDLIACCDCSTPEPEVPEEEPEVPEDDTPPPVVLDPWQRFEKATLAELIGAFEDVLPRRGEEFDMSLARLLKLETGKVLPTKNLDQNDFLMRGFIAAHFVTDSDGLQRFIGREFVGLVPGIEEQSGGAIRDADDRLTMATRVGEIAVGKEVFDLSKPLGDLMADKPVFGELARLPLTGAELAALTDAKLFKAFTQGGDGFKNISAGGFAAAVWLANLIRTQKTRR